MRVDQLLNAKLTSVTQCLGAVNTFSEMISDRFDRLANFVASEVGTAAIYVGQTSSSVVNTIVAVPAATYSAALNYPNTVFNLQATDTGDTVSVIGSDITDAVADQLSELKVENEFIDYCLRDTASADGFIGRMRDLYPSIESASILKFSKFLELGGSPLEAIRSWLSTFASTKLTKNDDDFIQLTDVQSYSGNVFIAAFTQIWDQITGFFEGVWEGITHLDDFFKNLLQSLLGLGKWLLGLAFGNLFEDYEKSSSSIGLMDFPIFQFVINDRSDLFGLFEDAYGSTYRYYNDGYAHRSIFLGEANINRILDALDHATSEVIDESTYARVLDVPVPCNWPKEGTGKDPNDDDSPIGIDMTLRIGRSNSGQYILQGFLTGDYATFTKVGNSTDPGVYWAENCIKFGLLRHVGQVVPLFISKGNVPSIAYSAALLAEDMIDDTASDIAHAVKAYWNYADSDLTDSNKVLMAGLFLYALLMGPGIRYLDGSTWVDGTNTFLSGWYGPSSVFTPSAADTNLVTVDPIQITYFNTATYKPFVRSNPYGISIHYQTIGERADEVIGAVIKVLIAAAAIAVSIKSIKWRRAFQRKSLLLHANVDRLSWAVGEDPSETNLQQFESAFNQARKMDLLANLLGLTVQSVTTASTKLLSCVASTVGKGLGYTKDDIILDVNAGSADVIDTMHSLIG